jgi:hypothetical protein
MDLREFNLWLDDYGRAWEARDPAAAANLFENDGTYQVTPFVEPLRGYEAILNYWREIARTEEQIRFGYEVLAVTNNYGIARWWSSFIRVPPGLRTKLDGIFLICLDSERRCTSLREWWHKQQNE